MNLAATLGFYLISLGSLSLGSLSPLQGQASPASSQTQASPPQNPEPAPATPSSSGQTPKPPAQAKPSPPRPRHHKKAIPNCSNAATPLNPTPGSPAISPNSTGAGDTGSPKSDSIHANTTNGDSTRGSTNTGSAALKPCPPPKKVVRNGGSDQPAVQLTGDTTAEQASHKRASTEQITAATEENLKKAAGLQLNASQQEMVSQIKQFMAQSKAAVAAGDLERGHNLAMKAHLLSDELVKP
jgi:hypothetical protein